ncbi:uncharacterized protein PRCAT00000634001 [Priceomyces carsonii]|uniref:uncharacterized protein n=1 Tax=Priceomyces carsonii TaxID=28549 RepID=UPI002ED7D322|nr:unnamed protein product [Priceomyces carsonii]
MVRNHSSNLAFFDVKLKSNHKDLILIKGNESECDSIPFEGSVKLSINEDMHVRRIKLNLISEFNIEFVQRSNGYIVNLVVERLCALKVTWSNLLTSPDGCIKFGDYGDKYIKYQKLGSLKKSKEASSPASERPSYLRTKSQPSLDGISSSLIRLPKSGIDGTPFKGQKSSPLHSYLLPKGNYNLPFKIYLPANIPETVEGLKCSQLLYKVTCTIERGRFEKAIQKSKHIRIVRTLHPRNLNLTDSIDVNNSWAGKLQYNVSIPKKGLPIGATVPINILIVPIAKGLTLKGLTGSIVQNYRLAYNEGVLSEFEQVGKQNMPFLEPESVDEWHVKTFFKVPERLSEITQSCDLKDNILQVRHRLRIAIQLKNKEGHISEVRANLPVCIYLSANAGHVIGKHYEVEPHNGYFIPDSSKEDVLFKKDKRESNSIPQSPEEEIEEFEVNDMDRDDDAPPVYNQHYLDKVYDMSLPQMYGDFRSPSNPSSPTGSNPSTPNISGYFNLDVTKLKPVDRDARPRTPSLPLLNKVPSYEEAIDEDDDVAPDLAPTYSNNASKEKDSNIILSIPKAKSAHFISQRPLLAKSFSPNAFGRNHPPSLATSLASDGSPGASRHLSAHSRSSSTHFKIGSIPLKVSKKKE